METKFNFNSAICTSKVQSERLLALGLKKETADMHWYRPSQFEHDYWFEGIGQEWATNDIPAWSLHRIMSMLPRCVDGGYHLVMSYDHIAYRTTYDDVTTWWRGGGNLYDMIVETIEWLIKEGEFNKEYLV